MKKSVAEKKKVAPKKSREPREPKPKDTIENLDQSLNTSLGITSLWMAVILLGHLLFVMLCVEKFTIWLCNIM